MPEHDCLPLDQTASDVVVDVRRAERAAGARGPPTRVRHPRSRRARRGAVPPDRRVLDGHAAAHEARAGDRRRSRAGAARRADERPRPRRPRRHALARRAARVVRHLGADGDAPARRRAEGVRLRRDDRRGPARRRRRDRLAARAHRHRDGRRRPERPKRWSPRSARADLPGSRRRGCWWRWRSAATTTSTPLRNVHRASSSCRSTACRRASPRSTKCSCSARRGGVVSVVEVGRGAVYDRGYRPYEGPRGRRGAATFALYKASMRRALGPPAVVAPEGRAVHAARASSRSRRSSTSASATSRATASSTQRIQIITYRELRRRVGGAVAVRRAGRARCDVPRPPPARAAADVRPADHRRRLRRGQARRDRDDPVRVLVPAPGRAVRRQHARERQRARLLHRPPRRALEGAARGRCCSPSTTR